MANWPFAVKMGVAPALAIAALLALGVNANLEFDALGGLVKHVVRHDLERAAVLSLSAQDVQAINAGVYRMFSLRAAGLPEADQGLSAVALATRIDATRGRLAAMDTGGLTEAQIGIIVRVRGALAVYGRGIDHAAALVAMDFPRAVASIGPFDAVARRATIDLSQLADDAVRDARRTAEAAEAQVWRQHIVFLATSLAVCGFVGFCAWRITRPTVAAVRRIAHATLMVAKGMQVDVDRLTRADELGTIVDSLRAFQSNNERIHFLAHHDALTALPNRVLLHDRMELALADCGAGAEPRNFVIHCLDLDHFKAVNDTLGHPIGDGLLRVVAKRLAGCVRQGDTVARMGGDEFAIVQRAAGSPEAAAELAQRVVDTLSRGYEIDGHQIMIGVSIGIAMTPCSEPGVDVLLRNADMALYRAKTEGRSTFRFFEPDMDAALQQRRVLELDMRAALAAGQFELYYQPLVNVRSHEVTGFEALIRWHHPERGMISPVEFILLAEETGLIVQIGAWVLKQACADASTWKANLKVAVNLSPLQFKDRNLVTVVQQALTVTGLPAWRLDLEITEGVLLQESEATLATLHKLRALGIRISMDDFGTGYSSLSYLRSFPFDKIKIDQSFIRDLAGHSGSAAIVRAVTGLGSSLGIHTTAEGVETEEQLARLITEGCTEVQGYLFSPPRPAHEVSRLVEEISQRRATSLVPVVIEARRD
jgi:diguanylate cyclase (GGDEF)-like protein